MQNWLLTLVDDSYSDIVVEKLDDNGCINIVWHEAIGVVTLTAPIDFVFDMIPGIETRELEQQMGAM